MEFKEFTEYPNPESSDYDIYSSFSDEEEETNQYNEEKNKIYYELSALIGILEDDEFNNVEELYGITQQEYLNPTKETIAKVKNYLNIKPKSR